MINRPEFRKLSHDTVMRILRNYFIKGMEISQIAKQFDTHHATVTKIIGGVHHQDVYREFWKQQERL